MSNEYAATKEDLEGGGGGNKAKPRGKYTGAISRAKVAKDKNGKLYIGFGLSITHGSHKKQLAFENYLPLSSTANAYQKARRDSLYRALGLSAGEVPPGAPGGPDISVLEGVVVDFSIEHEFEDVPGEDCRITTSKSKKQPWNTDGWEKKLDANGNLVVDGETIEPKEVVTFFEISDDFEGLSEPGSGSSDSGSDAADDDEDSWG